MAFHFRTIAVVGALLAFNLSSGSANAAEARQAPYRESIDVMANVDQEDPVFLAISEDDDLSSLVQAGVKLPFATVEVNGAIQMAPPSEDLTKSVKFVRGTDDCGGLLQKPCGVLHNKTNYDIQILRDRGKGDRCKVDPSRNLWPNGSSSEIWKDTDCFGATVGRICYLFQCKRPGDYHKIRNHVWIWEVRF